MDYRSAGVSIDRGNEIVERIKPWAEKTRRKEQLGGLGGFGGLFQLDMTKYRAPVLVSGTDGVGTKLAVAQMTGVHDTIGIDAVAMCVNDILVPGAEPLFFLDYFAASHLEPSVAEAVIAGVAEGCLQAGCALVWGETAEMPGLYQPGEYDIAGFAVGAVEKEEIVDGSRITAGDVLVGISSSGLHSNGFSLTRKIIFERCGLKITDYVREWGSTVGEELLRPTRIYVRTVLALLAKSRTRAGADVKGMGHITGGGLLENTGRVLPSGLGLELSWGSWPVPRIFSWLQEQGDVQWMEMLRTYNMGIGFCLYTSADEAARLQADLEAAGEKSWVIGEVVASDRERSKDDGGKVAVAGLA